MVHRLTTRTLQLDARFVAWKLLPKAACSRWVLRWHLDKDCSGAATCTVLPGPAIALDFEIEGRSHHRYAEMHFTTTQSAHGQQRRHWWFNCPRCNRRCRILYLPHGSPDFACRICLGLRYPSEFFRGGGEVAAFAKALYLAEKAAPHPSVEEPPGILGGVSFPLAIAS